MTRPFARRQFLNLAAAALACPAAVQADTGVERHDWRGTAIGAGARITLYHPRGDELLARARAEIDRLEDIFSLYRADSALSRLNRDGGLAAPPFELLDCLSLCARVHRASGGLFDPSVQPLWALYAEAHNAGQAPTADQITAVLARVGWKGVHYDSREVRLRTGMALTLNGVAQGYVADRVAVLLERAGATRALVYTGEIRTIGAPAGRPGWSVQIDGGPKLSLSDRGLATSAPLGTVFDAGGEVGHILHPRTGRPVPARWRLVSVSAPRAAPADALATAGAMMPDRARLAALVGGFRGARIEAAVPA
ncbi:FAD:protein FMN transferase [Sediminimonas sp.]|uniref:FAD:protein FMN transferase n=1 Tax=Sediminimonas sp. TaxID=2823379 RepID=UPI0025D4965C|nr:FAD:protein FMN transferase [Sediminimonas sp.]